MMNYITKNLTNSIVPTRNQYTTSVAGKKQPLVKSQTQPLHDEQVKNNAGGYVFSVDDMIFFQRFLFLGSENGTYYATEQEHTYKNVECISRLLKNGRGEEMLDMMISINDANRVAKSAPMLFALAFLAKVGDVNLRKKVYANLSKFLRIPTHLFEFLEYAKLISKEKSNSSGWGRLQREFVQQWYNGKDVDTLTYQVTKYQQRIGWSHRDVFRLAHVVPKVNNVDARDAKQRQALYSWIVKKELPEVEESIKSDSVYKFLSAFSEVSKLGTEDVDKICEMISKHHFVREHLPTQVLNSAPVWQALLRDMPLGALIRNLNKMTKLGLFDDRYWENVNTVTERLTDETALSKARIHPLKLIVAMATYSKGRGDKGSLTWTPKQKICDALNNAYYKSLKFVSPTGKRFFIGLDVSGSMGGSMCLGTSLSAREGSACLALTLMKMEEKCTIKGFSHQLIDVKLSPERRLDDNIRDISGLPFGYTDLSLPMTYALKEKIPIDCFVILSDNETYYGSVHPSEALRAYREQMNIDARYVNVQMSATKFSVADPKDVHSLEIAGFDSGMLETIAEFLSWEML